MNVSEEWFIFPGWQPFSLAQQAAWDALAGEAGCVVAGGHSINDHEPKYGLAVTGFVPLARMLANAGAREGDALVLTKALGTGIRYSPREIVVTDYQADSGKLAVRLEGAWIDAFKAFKGRDIPVTSKVLRDHALAFCFIPATLFNDED